MMPTGATDAHCHVWRLDDGERFPMREKIPALARDFTLEELARLQSACGVAGTVLVQAVDSVRESERLLADAARDDRVLGVVAWADPTREDFEDVVARYRAAPKFVGIRPMPRDTFGGAWLRDPATARALAHLAHIGRPVDVLVMERDLDDLHALLRRCDGVRCVLNHAGRPAVMSGALASWRERMQRLAAIPTVAVKCSGLAERAGVEWTPATLRPWIAALLETFGPTRVVFASNWPTMTLACRYDLWVETLLSALQEAGASAHEIGCVMRDNAAALYGLRVAGRS